MIGAGIVVCLSPNCVQYKAGVQLQERWGVRECRGLDAQVSFSLPREEWEETLAQSGCDVFSFRLIVPLPFL